MVAVRYARFGVLAPYFARFQVGTVWITPISLEIVFDVDQEYECDGCKAYNDDDFHGAILFDWCQAG